MRVAIVMIRTSPSTDTPDPADGRRTLIRLTPHGVDLLTRSAEGFDRLRDQWARTPGEERLAALERDLRTMAPGGAFRLDAAGWFTD